jgi:diaminopimelate decarboxylase
MVDGLDKMRINGSKVTEIAEKHGTPLYVYNEDKIREQYRELEESLCSRYVKVHINYAVKSNFNPRIAEILIDEGAGLDCASKAELELADRLDAEEVMYTAPYNRKDELEYAVEKGAEVNLDSVFLLDKMSEVPEMICFRIDPEIDSDRDLMFAGGDAKFGISEEKAVEAYRKAKKMGVEKFGIHMMTGSNVTDASYFEYITERLLKVAKKVSRQVGIEFEFVDIGGGLGIPYRPEEDSLDIDAAAEGIVKEMKKGIEQYDIGEPELRLEPGRYLTAEAGHLISRVTGVKQKDTEYVGLDTGMHQILRPSLLDSYHEIRKVEKKDDPTTEERTVVGQVCSSIDVIAEERELPELKQGDLVSIEDVGAYGFVMASHWNSRPLPAEVLVQGNSVELIRERQNKEQIFHGTFLDN